GTSIHLPLDCFETIDMAFDRPITPRTLEGCRYGRILLVQPNSKAAQLRHRTLFCLRQPRRELRVQSLLQEPAQGQSKVSCLVDLWAESTQVGEEGEWARMGAMPPLAGLSRIRPPSPGTTVETAHAVPC